MTQMDMSSETLRQADLVPLARAIKNSKFDVAKAEFARIDAYEKQIEIGKAFCIDMLEDMLKLRVNLCYVLLFAALLRRHRRAGDFNVLDHFLTRARETVDQYDSFPQFFQMQLMFAAKRRDKTFFLYDTLSQGTYQHELANTQLCRDRIGTAPAPTRSPDAPIRTVVFCASFLPESYNIKHAQMFVDFMVYLATYRARTRCVLLLTYETVFNNDLFPVFSQESANQTTIRKKIEAANAQHGLDMELICIDSTLPHLTRLKTARDTIIDLNPDLISFAGGYGKCESYYLAYHFRERPSVFLPTSASNTVAEHYTAVFTKEANTQIAGAEGKIIAVPSTSFEGFDVSVDAQGDRFFDIHKDKKVVFSALGGDRIFKALSACGPEFFVQLDTFLSEHPDVIWVFAGVRSRNEIIDIDPVIERNVTNGQIVVLSHIKNFGHYMQQSRVFVSLPNSIGGGFSGTTATSLNTPTICCFASDLPGAFQPKELCFADENYTGLFKALSKIVTDDAYHAGIQTTLQDIKEEYSLETVSRRRFEAMEQVISDFHA
ncbi:hypothetical protein [Jannaschia sp. M317]|uniref:hypothetical protein n=1 Tax=Jannaschia sp. M317 TaxID=2867011 RepID=UPI0021A94948|nr:hypothetical protein [Jannaschia sp. M317]UWQ19674.1 hypothetical protein K3551_18145 [Jannaschia sp. M317]